MIKLSDKDMIDLANKELNELIIKMKKSKKKLNYFFTTKR